MHARQYKEEVSAETEYVETMGRKYMPTHIIQFAAMSADVLCVSSAATKSNPATVIKSRPAVIH